MKQPKPIVGMGATLSFGSDRYPYTIIKVSNTSKTISVQADIAVSTLENREWGERQEYQYTSNPNGIVYQASLRKDGCYRVRRSDIPVLIGIRRRFEDPCF